MRPSSLEETRKKTLDAFHLGAFVSLIEKGSCELESTILGGSMGETFPAGSRIRIRFAAEPNLEAGQVVTYIACDRIVAHRLIRLTSSHGQRYAITRGDATACCDAPVLVSSVIGILTELQSNSAWLPVAAEKTRSVGSQLLAGAAAGVVLVTLKLRPTFSVRTARCIFGVRSLVLRSTALLKRTVQHFSFSASNPRS